jgi:DNA-binding protein HU-beta
MIKKELIANVSMKTGIQRREVMAVLEAVINQINDCLVNGEPVTLRGFGTFFCSVRNKRTARDIHKNTTIVIPERYVVKFKLSVSTSEIISSKKVTTTT